MFTTSLSDHDMVACIRKINHLKYPIRSIKCRNYAKYIHQNMCSDINEIGWQPLYQATDVNIAVNYFNTEVRQIFDKHAPIVEKRAKGRPCKWLTSEVKTEMNHRDKALRKARKTNIASDWLKYKKTTKLL